MQGKRGKLQTQLVAIFLLISILPALIIMSMSIGVTTNSTRDLVSIYTEQIAQQLNYNTNNYINTARAAIGDILASEYVKTAISRYDILSASEQSALRAEINVKVLSIMNTQDEISGVYICSNGKICYKNVKVKDTFDIQAFEESKAYQEMKAAQDTAFYWFSVGERAEKRVYLARKAASSDKGYVVMMMSHDTLAKLLDLANVDTCMSIAILDQKDQYILATNENLVINQVVLEEIEKAEEPISVKHINNTIICMIKLSNGWKVVSAAPVELLMAKFNQSCKSIVFVLMILIVLVIGISLVVGKKVTLPIVKMASYMNEVQKGNLEIEYQLRHDISIKNREVQMLVSGFSSMLAALKEMMTTSKKVTMTAKNNTSELQHQAQTTSQSAEDVSTTIETISKGALNQRDATEEVVRLVTTMSESINEVGSIMEEIGTTSQYTKSVSDQTCNKLEALQGQSERNVEISHKVSESVQELGNETKNISNILSMIERINKQTNLLAINASIEAVRAGESGKGFMVVAEEVRKLSTEIEQAIKKIAEVVQVIDEKRQTAVADLSEAMMVFDEQQPLVKDISEIFYTIYKGMNGIDKKLNTTNALITKVIHEKQNVEDKIKAIAYISDEFACVIEEVNAQMIEQVQASNTISHLASQLMEDALSLETCYI